MRSDRFKYARYPPVSDAVRAYMCVHQALCGCIDVLTRLPRSMEACDEYSELVECVDAIDPSGTGLSVCGNAGQVGGQVC